MILCDIGNTTYHFLDGKNSYKKALNDFNPLSIKEKIYYICVNSDISKKLKNLPNWVDLSMHVDRSKYYDTMGIDRITACMSVKNGIIVDVGSAITVDVVKHNNFMGGFIYPGIKTMQECYAKISKKLEYEFNFELDFDIMPKNSQDAISYGYLKLLRQEVLSYDLDIFLTGGDAKKILHIFPKATLDELLVFKGMKKIIKKVNLC